MPLIDRKHPLHPKVLLYNETGIFMGNVAAVNTDEGWFEIYPLYPKNEDGRTKVIVDRLKQEHIKLRVHAGFEIRERGTEKVLYKITWSFLKDGGKSNLTTFDWTEKTE